MEVVGYMAIAAVLTAFVYAFVRKAPLSLTISIAILVVYALLAVTSASWGDSSRSRAYWDLVLWHQGGWHVDETLTFLTSMFVHENLLHVSFNIVALIFIGTPLEERIGSPAFALMFVVGGFLGTMTYYLLNYPNVFVLLGASGAISAELGAFARLHPKERIALFLPVPIPPVPAIWIAIGFLILSSMMVFVIPRIAHEAHIGGLLTGLLLGPLVVRLSSKSKDATGEVDLSALERLAKTAELRGILAKIDAETLPDIRHAWIEELVERATCPECGGPLRLSRLKIISECGWRLNLR